MNQKNRLTANDWILAGLNALTAGGPQAVKAEAIARDLRVSKGSFYWHFKDVTALKTAMLDHWQDIATKQIVTTDEYSRLDPKEQLRLLVRIASGNNSGPQDGHPVEAAIRDWARYDDAASTTLQAVERLRLAFLSVLFEKTGADAGKAASQSKMLYAALIGLQQLSHHKLACTRDELPALLEILLRDGSGR